MYNCLLLIEQLCTVCVCLSCVRTNPHHTDTHTYTHSHIPAFFFLSHSVNGFLAAGADDKLEKRDMRKNSHAKMSPMGV